MEGTLAEVRMFAGNFSPRGWQFCNGQLLSIAQWTAVFALVGTTYGGNGQTTLDYLILEVVLQLVQETEQV